MSTSFFATFAVVLCLLELSHSNFVHRVDIHTADCHNCGMTALGRLTLKVGTLTATTVHSMKGVDSDESWLSQVAFKEAELIRNSSFTLQLQQNRSYYKTFSSFQTVTI